ncbi:MAG: double-strand break repair protein AddB [Alphaproteobacteria bacterium]|nr:double-strand break repair protein AddB [Alphaproteobacteria bacterium]
MTAAGGSVFNAPAPRLYSIDAGRPFLVDLARALHESVGGDPLALAEMRIFAPTRRAVRALTDAFVAAASGRASLLPKIRALGDVDEDEFLLDPGEEIDAADLPPAISPMERRIVLAKFVAAAESAFDGAQNWAVAFGAARELGALLDSFYAEEIPFDRLEALAPAEHAAHWERSLKFLKIATEAWPAYLKRRGLMDPAERRARLIDLLGGKLEGAPPQSPVIVAGSTGSAPAVARLMKIVAQLPKGAVVLPGLDRDLVADAKAWRAVDDPHPQAGLKALLERIEIPPETVRPWPGSGAQTKRSALLSLALRPAGATDDWRRLVEDASARDPALKEARAGLSLIEAADEEAEAAAVALLFRETLETDGKTAMLVTPDRTLGRRVAAKMRRWNVAVDDSGGVPFANSPCGVYLRLVADWLAAPSDPVALLSLARARLAGFGLDGGARAKALATLDRALRGVAPGPGIEGLRRKLDKARDAAGAAPIVEALAQAAALWPAAPRAAFEVFLAAHVNAAEALAADGDEMGAVRLWRGDDGEKGAALIAEMREMAGALGEISVNEYRESFAQLLAGASLRRRSPAHPRLRILGPLEARLQSADLVILGGLNEGVWPGEAPTDPFLSREMRKQAGLPSPERRLGLAAHDFAALAAAREVALTRARMAGGAPAKPSRWIVRLKNILGGAGAASDVDATMRLAAWTHALDKPHAVTPATRPQARAPLEARPRKLGVTRFEKLMRDPYGIYARYILRLKKLDPLAQPAGKRELGRLLHTVFEIFARESPEGAARRARLSALLDEHAAAHGVEGAARVIWSARLEAALDWFEDWDRAQRLRGAPAVVEGEGEWTFPAPAGPFTLTARADRIDRLEGGGAALFDFKTGVLPSLKQVQAQFNPQLPLTAVIVEEGGFSSLGPARAESFHYVKSLNRSNEGRDQSGAEGDAARALIEEARRGLEALLAYYDAPDAVYLSQPRPQFADDYGDYDHLARRREWLDAEGEE